MGKKRAVVVGLGMAPPPLSGAVLTKVAREKLLKYDAHERQYIVTVLGEESHVAYNRVGLTSSLRAPPSRKPYDEASASLGYHIDTKVTYINSASKTVTCENGDIVPYDILVLATGSQASLPRHTPGWDAEGVFVYRTIDDLVSLIGFSAGRKGSTGCVVGVGLLGLEAAKAMMDLESFSSVKLIERNGWVLSRQLDQEAGAMAVQQVRHLGLDVMLSKRVREIKVDDANHVAGVVFEDGQELLCSTVCFAIGIAPRDELARVSGFDYVRRGGGIATVGLLDAGRDEKAEVFAFNLTQAKLHAPRVFKRPDLSTKLKFLGVNVASFGDFFADRDGPAQEINPFQNIYKKYIFTSDGEYLLGGMMVGDTNDYIKVVPMVKNIKELHVPPSQPSSAPKRTATATTATTCPKTHRSVPATTSPKPTL
ncbi:nitrite reductase [Metarhizium album ARSEF 1941]|uniref:Nitrite reductase n=1 Tax=Metarhizium album (strain ARSEF 1941) TaxID=1081103 RepID=A0A0B2WZS2_METAS|nr:nitrite reductase [Metarhizium album ARSEF 1941]KHO01752.1 nitrite reductase [Metarhizium album ARSEF 1941]